jgi:hypothetical protein
MRYVGTSFMCETVDGLYATIETHRQLYCYVLKSYLENQWMVASIEVVS